MPKLDVELEIPFVENTGSRCVPACATMILGTLMPEHSYAKTEVEELSGFVEGRPTWATQHLLSLNTLGIDVGWIQDEDLPAFAANPVAYMRNQVPDAAFERFTEKNNLELEAHRIQEYLGRDLPFEQRPATHEDIRTRLLAGWLVRLEVNGKPLAGELGLVNHAVLVSGFNDNVVRLENPDGLYGSKPKQIITWDELDAAWDEPTLQYYRSAATEL